MRIVDGDAIVDWRIKTMDCIDMLKLPDKYGRFVARRLEDYFEPLISERATQIQKDEVWDKILDVCQKSLRLKISMQRSKVRYEVRSFESQDLPAYTLVEHFVESMGVESGCSNDASEEIAYQLFGALLKHSKLNARLRILVRAEVMLKRKRSW